jgi:PAS domain S-box-containing protein
MVSVAIRDVTERREAARARSQLASIVRSSRDAIVGVTPAGVIESWNPGAERLYGYRADEAIGQHVDLLAPGELAAEEAQVLARVISGERVEQYEIERVHKDGTPVTVSVTVAAITDLTETVLGVASISHLISGRRSADAKVRRPLEAASDPVVGVDADGTVAVVDTPVFADRPPRPIGAGTARRCEGREFPAEISRSAVNPEGGTLVSAAIRDVGEGLEAQAAQERLRAGAERPRRVERRLRQSRRLESVGQLPARVAHDVENLLGAIMNYGHVVAEEISAASAGEPRDWAAVRRDVNQIELAAKRAFALTHQLLTFDRREVGQPRVLGDHVELVTPLDPGLAPIETRPSPASSRPTARRLRT